MKNQGQRLFPSSAHERPNTSWNAKESRKSLALRKTLMMATLPTLDRTPPAKTISATVVNCVCESPDAPSRPISCAERVVSRRVGPLHTDSTPLGTAGTTTTGREANGRCCLRTMATRYTAGAGVPAAWLPAGRWPGPARVSFDQVLCVQPHKSRDNIK